MKSSNEHFKRICNVYNQQYNGNLKEDMISGTYGFLNNLIGSLFNFSRDETMKTNVFQAKQIFGEFETICSGQSIDMCINVLFWDDTSLRDVLLNVIKIVTKTSIYFSQVLKDIISSSETRGANLTYYIVARSEIDICDIKIEYQKQHNNISLEQAIESGFCGKQYGLFKARIFNF
uniref:Annexin n=1 Tax=Meloidogyne hapla TaxID=6305 RepID=A0A1I8B5V9_MELHA